MTLGARNDSGRCHWGACAQIGYNERRMRIAISGYFLLHPSTGTGQYTIALVKALGQICDDELVLVCPGQTARLATSLLEGRRAPWRVLSLPVPAGDLGKLWFEQVGLPRACRPVDADVLHVPYMGSPLLKPCRTVVTVHDLIMLLFPETRRSPQARAYTWLASAGVRRADFILADSLSTQKDLVRRLRIPESRIRVGYLACDEDFRRVDDGPSLDRVRSKYGLEREFLFYIGGLDWRKNVPRLLRAFSMLKQKPQLAIAGRALSQRQDSFPDLPGIVRELGLDNRVVFLGVVPEEDKASLYSACHAFVFPSLYEGFGLTPLEAMACGAPVVCSNASSIPEIVGDAAIPFDPLNEGEMARAMAEVLENSALREQMSRKGLALAKQFSWRRTAEEAIEVYRQVAGGTPAAERIWGNEGLARWNTALRRAQQEVTGRHGKVLEVGCGAGRFMRSLRGRNPGASFFGCDLDPKSLAAGLSQGDRCHYAAADVHSLPYADSQFATVLIFDVLEHLREPRRALQEINRVMEPGGLLHALVPCEGQPGSLHWLLWLAHCGADLKKRHSGHIQRFTRRGAARLLAGAGFRIEHMTYSMHPLGQARDILSYVQKEDWFRRRRLDNPLFRGLMRVLWGAAYVESNVFLKNVPVGSVVLHVTARKSAAP